MVTYKLRCNDCKHVFEVEINGRKSPYNVPCPNYFEDTGELCNSKSITRLPNQDEEISASKLHSLRRG